MAIEPLRHRLHQQTHTPKSWWKWKRNCKYILVKSRKLMPCSLFQRGWYARLQKERSRQGKLIPSAVSSIPKKPYHLLFLLFSSPTTTRDIFFFWCYWVLSLFSLPCSFRSTVFCVCVSFLYAKNQQQHDIRVPLTISMQSVVVEWLSKLLGY